jgi:hypothetical protein
MPEFTRRGKSSRRKFLRTASAAAVVPPILTRRLAGLETPALSLPPLLARPTGSSILIHARNGLDGVNATVEVSMSDSGEPAWQGSTHALPGDFLEWSVDSLKPGTRYRYSIRLAASAGSESIVARGGFITQRAGEESFTAALITDPHTGTFAESSPQVKVMDDVIRNVGRDNPDFAIALGDNVAWASSRDQPQQSKDGAERAYEMYRRHIGPLVHSCPHFSLLGNWDGETGKFPQASIDLVRAVRHRYLPNPDNATYPQGGSASQDYYAFTWGPALFVVLNVQSYTNASTPLKLPTSADVTRIEDWTLGGVQMSWLDRTLKASGYPFKFLCIHHAVGGDAGNTMDTLYGRGGARAARVGEQKIVHQLMLDHGVQAFFYGHDHVFVDDVADGIHYALPGSFGAPWHFGPETTGYARFWVDSGHARLTVSPREARVDYINQAGSVFHSFTMAPK